jgi:hypothetical protein
MRLQLRFPYQVRLRAALCGVESTEITSFAENEEGRASKPRPGLSALERRVRSKCAFACSAKVGAALQFRPRLATFANLDILYHIDPDSSIYDLAKFYGTRRIRHPSKRPTCDASPRATFRGKPDSC